MKKGTKVISVNLVSTYLQGIASSLQVKLFHQSINHLIYQSIK